MKRSNPSHLDLRPFPMLALVTATLPVLPWINYGAEAALEEALDTQQLEVTTGGDADWFLQTAITQDGSDAAQSGEIGGDQSSRIETTIVGPGFISFWWKVSSEAEYDWLRFSINGEDIDQISGEVEWEKKVHALDAGNHRLAWTYSKDADLDEGTDAAWLDQVTVDRNPIAPSGNVTVAGIVTDAVSGLPLPGVRIQIGDVSTESDEEGAYTVEGVRAGSVFAEFTASIQETQTSAPIQFFNQSNLSAQIIAAQLQGYVSLRSPIEIPLEDEVPHSFSMSPALPEDSELRLVLTWDANPEDIDAHLLTPFESPNFHIFYANPGNSDSSPFSRLDTDAREGFGPETITIHQLHGGTYYFYVENYSDFEIRLRDETRLFHSNAKVQVYSSEGLIHELRASSSPSSIGYYWDVLRIDGATKEITIINRITQEEPPSTDPVGNEDPVDSDVAYLWDFGDGTKSTEENPTKVYSQPGTYPVRLTVETNGNSATVTKDDYVKVIARTEEADELAFTSIRIDGNGIVLEWTGVGTLQLAPELGGSWEDVAGATSPYNLAPSEAQGFFRIRR